MHPKLPKPVKRRLRETCRTLDPVVLLAEMRRCQEELGQRIDARGVKAARRRALRVVLPVPTEVGDFARMLGTAPPDVRRLATSEPGTFGDKQHSMVQRLLRSLRRRAAETALAGVTDQAATAARESPVSEDGAANRMLSAPPTAPLPEQAALSPSSDLSRCASAG